MTQVRVRSETSSPTIGRLIALLLGSGCFSVNVGCGQQASDAVPSEPTRGVIASALSPASNDSDTADANVVVAVGSTENPCSGILITPQIVLTANHCIFPEQDDGTCRRSISSISVGPVSGANFEFKVRKVQAGPPGGPQVMEPQYWAATEGCYDARANDLALLYLDEAVAPAAMRPTLEKHAVPPRVRRPTLSPWPAAPYGAVDGPFGGAGYSVLDAPVRQVASYARANFHTYTSVGEGTWGTTLDIPSNKGDSGGPLFFTRPGGQRDVVGVLSGRSPFNVVYADVTAPYSAGIISYYVKHGTVPAAIRQTPEWLSRHGKTVDDWWGELDYSTGECDTQADQDCDGWWDVPGIPGKPVHDNCRFVANPNQLDSNNDGYGDACSRCPFDPGNDEDKDGVCAKGPPGETLYKVDNCPIIQNGNPTVGGPVYPLPALAQTNCNEEAERAWNANHPSAAVALMGDACDPVPCPDAKAVATGSEYRNPVGGGHPQFGGFYSGRVFMNNVSTRRVGSHKKETPPYNQFNSTPRLATVTQVPTYGRYCQQNDSELFKCHDPGVLQDSQLTRFASRAAEFRSPSAPWLRVETSLNAGAPNGWWSWSYDTYHNLMGTPSTSTWSYLSDWNYWTSRGLIPAAEARYQAVCSDLANVGPGTCLSGTMWFHAATPVGATQGVVGTLDVGVHGDELANHYFDVKPDQAYARTYSGTGLMRQLFFVLRGYPDPAPYESVIKGRRTRPLVAAEFQAAPKVLDDHGGSWDADEQGLLGSAASATLAAMPRWVSVSEPIEMGGNLDARLQAMAVSDDGTAVLDTLILSGSAIEPAWVSGFSYASDPSPFAPSPRSDFASVLSRTAGGLFIIGGVDPLGVTLQDIHFYRPEIGWSEIRPTTEIGRVVAAAFSPIDGKLWLLDRRASSATLRSVDPWNATVSTLGTWSRTSTWDNHFLAVDRDGNIVLVASSSSLAKSKIARLRVNAAGGVYAVQIDQEAIPFTSDPPIVDADEYGLIVRDGTGAMTSVFRRGTLIGAVGSYSLSSLFQ